jgi:hypothetical protein
VLTGAHDRYVDAAERFLHGAGGGHARRPDWESHLRQLGHVSAAGVDDQSAHTTRVQCGGEQFAEVTGIRERRRCHDKNVAVTALLDGDVDHPVVGRRHAHSHGGASDVRPRIDRCYVRGEQAASALGLVHGGDSVPDEGIGNCTRRTRWVADNDRHRCLTSLLGKGEPHRRRATTICPCRSA